MIARRGDLVDSVKIVGPVVVRAEGLHAILLPMPVIAMGRTSMEGAVADISLSYALVSRAQNGLRLSRTDTTIRFERLGGANSVFIGDASLDVGQEIEVDVTRNGIVIALGGPEAPKAPGHCRLRFTSIGDDAPTNRSIIQCQVDFAHLDGGVSGDLEWHWPGWREDKAKTWIMFDDGLGLDVSPSGTVSLAPTGPNGTDQPKARLRYTEDSGYFIEPSDGDIAIDGSKTTSPGPIRDGTIVHIADAKLSFAKVTRR